jgi:hypothetical protein
VFVPVGTGDLYANLLEVLRITNSEKRLDCWLRGLEQSDLEGSTSNANQGLALSRLATCVEGKAIDRYRRRTYPYFDCSLPAFTSQ